MRQPGPWRVVARGFDGVPTMVATRVDDREDAERLAERWMLRGDVNAVAVEREAAPAVAPKIRRSYR
jgi:hypothetical protein